MDKIIAFLKTLVASGAPFYHCKRCGIDKTILWARGCPQKPACRTAPLEEVSRFKRVLQALKGKTR